MAALGRLGPLHLRRRNGAFDPNPTLTKDRSELMQSGQALGTLKLY
jgi:hypothetical protein